MKPARHGPGSTGKLEWLCLFPFLVESWDRGGLCPTSSQQGCAAGWGEAGALPDLLNESIMFSLLFSHLHQQLLPAKEEESFVFLWGEEKHKIEWFLETKTLSRDNQGKRWGTAQRDE